MEKERRATRGGTSSTSELHDWAVAKAMSTNCSGVGSTTTPLSANIIVPLAPSVSRCHCRANRTAKDRRVRERYLRAFTPFWWFLCHLLGKVHEEKRAECVVARRKAHALQRRLCSRPCGCHRPRNSPRGIASPHQQIGESQGGRSELSSCAFVGVSPALLGECGLPLRVCRRQRVKIGVLVGPYDAQLFYLRSQLKAPCQVIRN